MGAGAPVDRAGLLEERAAVAARLAELSGEVAGVVAASEDANLDDEHDPEGATVAFERSRLESARLAAARRLASLDAALGRLDGGDYGRCEGCGGAIGAERLAALPDATRCVDCATGAAGPLDRLRGR